jgi:AraC-like DNA-binding protein
MPNFTPDDIRLIVWRAPEAPTVEAVQVGDPNLLVMMHVIDHSNGRPRIDIMFMPLGPQAAGSLSATPAALAALEDSLSAELAPIVGGHLLDLVAAALGPTADTAELVATRGVKAARLRAVLAEIARRYADPDFDLDNVGRTLGLSRRYLQRLLEETGKSFTEHVAERRLQHAHAMLTDPRSAHLRIIDIVLAAGFSDVSHFNRLFRRRFGESPSGVRVSIGRESQRFPLGSNASEVCRKCRHCDGFWHT